MKDKRVIPINAINLTVVITVMIFVALLTQMIIKDLTIRDIQNVTRLTHTNIFSELNQEMVEPINTSVIMAQNTLLLDFMDEETGETEERLAEYLTAVQQATGYESVFIVPHSTLNYYHPGGTDDKVDLTSDHAYWYTNRIDATDAYGFVVNTENLDDWALTIYVDANINDQQGNFAGIAGVGKRIVHLQEILTRYLEDQGVEAYIVDGDGMIKVHENSDYIKNMSFYELEHISSEAINLESIQDQRFEKRIEQRFFIVEKIPTLNWYLVVKKSTSDISGALNYYRWQVILALAIGAFIILMVSNHAISMYKKQIINLSNIDHLTDISNRTIFEHALEDAVNAIDKKRFTLALFDLDNLKMINDTMGHDKGDYVLKEIASLAKGIFKSPHIVSRVGGDEFAVILYKPLEASKALIDTFQKEINDHQELNSLKATVSIGLTECNRSEETTVVYKRADEALYKSKHAGKNRIHVL